MRQRHLFTLLILFIVVLAGCQSAQTPPVPTLADFSTATPEITPEITNTPSRTPVPTATATPRGQAAAPLDAFLRVLHTAVDVDAVDIYLGESRFGTNLGYAQATGKTPLAAGNYSIKITARGEETALAQTDLSLQSDQSVVLMFGGTADALTTRILVESTERLRDGESRVTFINAVPEGTGAAAWVDNRELTAPLGFGQSSDPVVTSSGQSTITFRSGDTTRSEQTTNLTERMAYTFVLTGQFGSERIIVFSDRVIGRPSVRVINAAPLNIDLALNSDIFARNIANEGSSPRQYIDSGVYLVSVYPAGETTPLLENAQVTISADENLSLIVIGNREALRLVTHRENLARTPVSTARVSFVNALPEVELAGVGANNMLRDDILKLGYGQSSRGADFPAGETNLFWQRIQRSIPGDVIETARNTMLNAGYNYLYILTGANTTPLLLSDEVGIDERSIAEVVGVEALPTSTSDPGAYVRFVNAINEAPVIEVWINGLPVVTALEYSQASSLTAMPAGQYTVTVQTAGLGTPLLVTTFTPPPPGDYTLLFYSSVDRVRMLMITDTNLVINEVYPSVRLINLSVLSTSTFGLASENATEPLEPETTVEPGQPIQSLSSDARSIIPEVENGGYSNQRRGRVGIQDLLVFYARVNRVAKRLPSVTLSAGMHYDIVAFELSDRSEVRAFIIPYPQR